ncbi:PduL/EutD family phosphate acyltransferase [Caproiciproducens galactitolivorans]|uniref:Phosphate propanoyltransferase n=1 Tax=Caproiciproducens galactitolivorans TaxID=642589 RepID=A0ABT4BV48_9FIRM|nr:phosphate propanoyltransferase [Caproiciproducens galactitolivorans]MCY1714766.1 phosphate propanoyltransferase [Caproiciproducens galactitolivorans]
MFVLKIMVETSARHIHLTQEDLDTLFGKDYKLTPKKDLSQVGQFACVEKVEVIGPKSSIKMSILGPVRPETQVELAKTEARSIGIDAPTRMSGDLKGTPGCKVIGPKGEITIDHGVIVAKRHAHFTPEQAVEYGVKDGQNIQIKLDYNERALIFGDVIARVSKTAGLAVHIDTDEANAAGLPGTVDGEVIL